MLRAINWNLSYQGDINKKLKLLRSVIAETQGRYPWVITLQEVTKNSYLRLLEEELFRNHAYSLNLREPGLYEANSRKLGCLVIYSNNITIRHMALIDRAPFPERALAVKVHEESTGVEFEVLCFHSLTGVDYKKAKSAQFASLADYLHAKRTDGIILGCDLNEPKVDNIDVEKVEFFSQNGDKGKAARLILSPDGAHNLQDAYRLWLAESQGIKDRRESHDYSEPLAVSHIVRGGSKKRYDYIMVSPHWRVANIEYRYEDAVKHGSDHAVVVADLEWIQD